MANDETKIKDLKTRFSAQRTPRERDFAELIDMANAANYAAGVAKEQNSQGAGLVLDTQSGRLSIKAGEGIKPLETTGAVAVNYGDGLKVESGQLKLALKDNGGLVVDANGQLTVHAGEWFAPGSTLALKAGPGIEIKDGKVNFNAKQNGGLEAVTAFVHVLVDDKYFDCNSGRSLDAKNLSQQFLNVANIQNLQLETRQNIWKIFQDLMEAPPGSFHITHATTTPKTYVHKDGGFVLNLQWSASSSASAYEVRVTTKNGHQEFPRTTETNGDYALNIADVNAKFIVEVIAFSKSGRKSILAHSDIVAPTLPPQQGPFKINKVRWQAGFGADDSRGIPWSFDIITIEWEIPEHGSQYNSGYTIITDRSASDIPDSFKLYDLNEYGSRMGATWKTESRYPDKIMTVQVQSRSSRYDDGVTDVYTPILKLGYLQEIDDET